MVSVCLAGVGTENERRGSLQGGWLWAERVEGECLFRSRQVKGEAPDKKAAASF